MKSLTLILAIVLAAALSPNVQAQEPAAEKAVKKIIKTIEIDENGNTIVDSTVVMEDEDINVFIHKIPKGAKGEKIIKKRIHSPGAHAFTWSDDEEMTYEINVETIDGDSTHVLVMKAPGERKEFKFGPEHKKHKIMMIAEDEDMPFDVSNFTTRKANKGIDLNDPNIISFEKETLKNGNEKITIIRKKKE